MVNAEIFARIASRIESFRNEMIDMQVRLTAPCPPSPRRAAGRERAKGPSS